MLVGETIAKIRRAYFQDKKPIKQICRALRVSRNTVGKVIRSGVTALADDLKAPEDLGVNHVALNLRFNQPDVEDTL
ncbi:MAG: hypothetical protein AAF646_16370, partial [Pseudomonadota bacterium]